ncbi:MAG: hypothetical protein QOJ99_3554 [Bryobacterales bacterium]|nr:hypothetical protein [Bryobacterales bacterium]
MPSDRWDLRSLRAAIWQHRVTFPAQIPTFRRQHRRDVQWRAVVLYFVRGWTLQRIAGRYGVTHKRVGQMVRGWADLAMSQGYVARIPSEEECGLV